MAREAELKTVSMTGFGFAAESAAGITVEVELKSVNGRFLDLNFRLPREYSTFEPDLRELFNKALGRGRIECYVSRKSEAQQAGNLKINAALVESYLHNYEHLCVKAGTEAREGKAHLIRDLISRGQVVEIAEVQIDLAAERALLLKGAASALKALLEMRKSEGLVLGGDITARLEELKQCKIAMAAMAVQMASNLKERLLSRVKKLAPEVALDETRLCTEVAMLADRVDITEELVRLEAHVQQLTALVCEAGTGKKMDFLIQECGRELNTVASKAQDAQLQRLAVDGKALLEQVREQVQNLE